LLGYLEHFNNQRQQWMADNLTEPQRLTAHHVTNDHQRLNSVAGFPVLTQPIKQVLRHNKQTFQSYNEQL